MRFFIFFMLLLIATICALHEEEIDLAILLLFLDIFLFFLYESIDILPEQRYYNTCKK